MQSRTIAVLFALVSSACVTDPYHNQFLPSKASSVAVQGFALSASTDVFAQCRPYLSSGAWTNIKKFTSSTSAINVGGDNVYSISGSMLVPSNCWLQWHPSQATTEIRFYQNTTNGTATYQMYDKAGRQCVYANIGDGKGAIASGLDSNCHPLGSIYIHAP